MLFTTLGNHLPINEHICGYIWNLFTLINNYRIVRHAVLSAY
nr:MAG TPA: hypothetical protein [Bacteriophage sp.]